MTKTTDNSSFFLNFCQQLIREKRYWFLLILFFLFLFFGQNILPNGDVDPTLKNIYTAEINTNSSLYQSKNALDTRPGEKYNILFQLKVDNTDNDFSIPAKETINVGLTDKLGNYKSVSHFDVRTNVDFYETKGIDFLADSEYQNLVFQKKDPNSHSVVFIKNIHVVRFLGDRKTEPSLVAGSDNSLPTENISQMSATSAVATTDSEKKLVGETFIASHEYLTSAKIKLHFRGNGGNGNYQLIVRKIVDGNISDTNIAYLSFNSEVADVVYGVDNVNQLYLFPLGCKLELGQKYFIGISSQNVKTNFFNNMQFFGSMDGNSDTVGEAVTISDHKTEKLAGDFYIKYYFVDQAVYHGEKVNFGDSFDDLGNGTGVYAYNSGEAHSNLDIFESTDDSVTYKINTFYSFNQLYFEASLPTNSLGTDYSVAYSFDNKNWHNIDEDHQANSAGHFTQQIRSDGDAREIYLKASGKTSDKTTFNFNSLAVYARVKIGN